MEGRTSATMVLELGAEGGALEVWGEEHDGHWRFRTTHDSTTMAAFLDEDDDIDPASLYHVSGWMDRWEDVIGVLDKEECWNLYPTFIHPRFKNAIKAALAERDLEPRRLEPWQRAISSGRGAHGREQERIPQELTVDVSVCQAPERRVVLDPAAFPGLQSLLNRLFMRHLHLVAPAHSYGRKWILINDRTMSRVAKADGEDDRSLGEAGIRPTDPLTVVLL